MKIFRACLRFTQLPRPRIARLSELAYNLWWSWNPVAQALYRGYRLPTCGTQVNHNPVKFLRLVSQDEAGRGGVRSRTI